MAIRPSHRPVVQSPSTSSTTPANDRYAHIQPPPRRRLAQSLEGDAAPQESVPDKAAKGQGGRKVDKTGPNRDENGDYLVGKNRTPKGTRWRPGQSGNPRGPKPKEAPDPVAEFRKEILAEFSLKMNGDEKLFTLGTFALQTLKAAAAKGTVKAQQILLNLFLDQLHRAVEANPTSETEEWERETIDKLLAELGLPAHPVIRQIERGSGSDSPNRSQDDPGGSHDSGDDDRPDSGGGDDLGPES